MRSAEEREEQGADNTADPFKTPTQDLIGVKQAKSVYDAVSNTRGRADIILLGVES